MSLRDYLDAAEALAPADLRHAIMRAAIYGGSLDTALLELGLVDPHGLEALLAAAHGLPTAPPELLTHRPRPWERLAHHWVEARLAAPLAAIDDRLWVAVHPDLPSDALARLWQEESALEVTVTAECCLRRILAERGGESLSARHAVLAATYLNTLRPPTPPASFINDDDEPPRASAPTHDPAEAEAASDAATDPVASGSTGSAEASKAEPEISQAPAAPPAPPEIRTFIPTTLRHAVPFPETHADEPSEHAHDPQTPGFLGPRSPAASTPSAPSQAAPAATPSPDALLPPLLRSRAASPPPAAPPPEGAHDHVPSDMSVDRPPPAWHVPEDIHAGAATVPARAPQDLTSDAAAHESALFPRLLRSRAADAEREDDAVRPRLLRPPSTPAPTAEHGPSVDIPREPATPATAAREPSATATATAASAAREPSAPTPAASAAPEPSAPTPAAASRPTPSRDQDAILPRLLRPRSTEAPAIQAPPEPRAEPTSEPSEPSTATGDPAHQPREPSTATSDLGDPTQPREPTSDVAPPTPGPAPEREEDAVLPRLVRPRSGAFLPTSLVHREAADPAALDALIDAALTADARVDAHASELRGRGPAALARLGQRFPGPQEPLRGDLRHLAPPSAQSPFLRLCVAVGDELVPHILDRLADPDPLVRFYGALVFQELRSAAAAPALAELAFDTDADVRTMAIRVLETYGRAPTYPRAIQRLRGELASESSERRRMAITALGTVRDVASLPRLIDVLADPDPQTRATAIASLCSITGQHFGGADARWRAWYADNGERHRIDWMLDSLGHSDVAVRRWAADELMRITGQRFPFPAAGEPAERAAAIGRWRAWWQAFQSRILG